MARKNEVAQRSYVQQSGVPALPIEDFYPGCIVATGQLLPGDVDEEKIVLAAGLGMRNGLIAASVGISEGSLIQHFNKTIARARANRAMELLGHVNDRADDLDGNKHRDLSSITYLLDRHDPKPDTATAVINIAPIPREILEMPAVDVTAQIKLLKGKA